MTIPTELRLSLLELTHLVDRLIRLYRTRARPELDVAEVPDLSRLCSVGELTLTQARALLDQDEWATPENTLRPPLHAPSPLPLAYRINVRRRQHEVRPLPSSPRPHA